MTAMPSDKTPKVISFQTVDQVTISADFYQGTNESAILLAHMLSRTRSAWGDFPQKLNQAGFTVLNIDLRGHGRSITQNGREINFKNFSEADFNKIPPDLQTAKSYLVSSGIPKNNISIVGASIGANAALIEAAGDHDIRALVLLSPGENYHGVKTYEAAKDYAGRPALIISSSKDTQSFSSSLQLAQFIGNSARFVPIEGAQHGTNILTAYPELKNETLDFLQAN